MLPQTYFNSNDKQQLLEVKTAFEVLLQNSQLNMDDSVVELRERLLNSQSRSAAAVLLRYSQSKLTLVEQDLDEFGEPLRKIAQDCRDINSTRNGLLRGPLSPLSVNKQPTLPAGVADFFEAMCEAKRRVDSLIATT